MKPKLLIKLLNCIEKYRKKKELKKKLKLRVDMDKTSKYKHVDFLRKINEKTS